MDLVYQYFENLKNAALANPIEFLATIAAIIGGIVLYSTGAISKLFGGPAAEANKVEPEGMSEAQLPYNPDNPVISLELYEARLKTRETELRKTREDELRAELSEAHESEKALLQAQIDELTRQQKSPEEAFESFKTRIAELEALLGNAETEDEQAAKAALEAGDLMRADEIFAKISEAQKLNITKAADAEYARGEIAEQQIRWRDALEHFTRAAELHPSFKTLRQHWDLLWKMGRFSDAITIGEKLEAAAVTEFGETTNEHAISLSCRGMILRAVGKFEEAEDLYREALKIGEATIGTEHPEYAKRLNNLASVLRAKGDLDGAEELYRKALKIGEATIGTAHPDYATRLNNLASVLWAKSDLEGAEDLFRDALKIDEATIGVEHPEYAKRLNNLASVLRAKGDLDRAEELYRKALKIGEATIGTAHPDFAARLNNLAKVLQDKGDLAGAEPLFTGAIEILSKALGDDHPNTKGFRENLRILREEMGQNAS